MSIITKGYGPEAGYIITRGYGKYTGLILTVPKCIVRKVMPDSIFRRVAVPIIVNKECK